MKIFITSLLLLFLFQGFAQKVPSKNYPDEEYWSVVSKRAAKIVQSLNLNNTEKEKKVQNIIAFQYYDLNKIHDSAKLENAKIKEGNIGEELKKEQTEKIKQDVEKKLEKLHKSYISKLQKELADQQIELVKNGMTYNVFVNTYAGYLDMLPNLTDEQKKYIYDALLEAREKAMDAGSSNEKHAWFGKYKGRINNYLSKAGYDLNKESKDWHERLKAREQK